MKNILVSAFACDPYNGSEPSYGWNWSVGLIREGYEVHTFTRIIHKENIENHPKVDHLHIYYIGFPFQLERLYAFSQPTMYLYYLLWQWKAYRKAKKLHLQIDFERIHHVSWGSLQQGSFLYKLNVPFIFGPAGGGQHAPESFKEYFLHHWKTEKNREKVSRLLFRFNPACKSMLKKAETVLVSNQETLQLANEGGAQNVFLTLDAALPKSFFPKSFISRQPQSGQMKLLWVGRFLPRKGLLLILDIMNKLREYAGITLTIIGDGQMGKEIREKHREYGLQNSVKLLGAVPFEEVRGYYASHDAFLFTSLRESGGIQLVEAMAFGLPVITIDLHGQGQIVTNETGIKVPMNSQEIVINDFKQAIIDLSNDTERYKSLSHAAYIFAKKQNWDSKIHEIVKQFYL
jgi:glycosyltransferase involved in cell wall biosynthesis